MGRKKSPFHTFAVTVPSTVPSMTQWDPHSTYVRKEDKKLVASSARTESAALKDFGWRILHVQDL